MFITNIKIQRGVVVQILYLLGTLCYLQILYIACQRMKMVKIILFCKKTTPTLIYCCHSVCLQSHAYVFEQKFLGVRTVPSLPMNQMTVR